MSEEETRYQKTSKLQTWGNLDRNLAIMGGAVALVLTLVLLFGYSATAFRYLEASFLLFLACITYLVIRRNVVPLDSLYTSEVRTRACFVLNIIFFCLYTYSMILIILRPEPYSRPLFYFITTVFMVTLIGVEIFLFSKKWTTALVLLKIMLITLVLRWVPQIMFSGFLGIDPASHRRFTEEMIKIGHIPESMLYYSKLPVMHLIIGSTSIITGLDYNYSALLSVGFFQVTSLLFVFLLGRLIFNSKTGLLAALLLGIADIQIEHGLMIRPISLGVFLMPVLLYLLLRAKQGVASTCLPLILGGVLILTHAIASFGMGVLMLLLWFGSKLYEQFYRTELNKQQEPVSLTFFMLYATGMLSWWMYVSGHITLLANFVASGFREGIGGWAVVLINESFGAKLEAVLAILGFNLFFASAIIGSLYILNRKFVSRYGFSLVFGGLILTGSVFVFLITERIGILPFRWYPIMQIAMTIQAAVGILALAGSFSGNLRKTAVLSSLLLTLSFFSITSPSANIDTPIYSRNTTVRYAFTKSEIKAVETASTIYDGTFYVDWYYAEAFGGSRIRVPLTSNFISGDYRHIEGLVLIREGIINKPIATASGPIKVDYDPRQRLEVLNFDHIYESGVVSGFMGRQTELRD